MFGRVLEYSPRRFVAGMGAAETARGVLAIVDWLGAARPAAAVRMVERKTTRTLVPSEWSLPRMVNHRGIHSSIRSGVPTCLASCACMCGKLTTNHRADAAVIHYLSEAALGTRVPRVIGLLFRARSPTQHHWSRQHQWF